MRRRWLVTSGMATTVCGSCGRPVPSEARFCPSCGRPWVGPSNAPEERRVVTVLFADIVGYTSLAEHLDPEKVKRLVESCFARLVADIEAYGGVVDKVLGDAIVALFGAPVAHEDDAERAVRAGLQMQATLVPGRRRASRASTRQAAPIEMRVGINTGEVLVGSMSGSDYTAMGDVVNTAARLQALAPPGGVLVGSATVALCSSAIICEPFGATDIRGREQGEAAVADHRCRPGRNPAGARRRAVRRSRQRAHPAGVGGRPRSRRPRRRGVDRRRGGRRQDPTDLRDHRSAAASTRSSIRATCAPYGQSNVWAPIATGFAAAVRNSTPTRAPTDVHRAVEKRVDRAVGSRSRTVPRPSGSSPSISHLFGHPSDLDRLDAAGARDAVARRVTDMMRRHASTRFTVLWVDNLQWADPMFRDQLAVVARSLADLPFLLVTAQRPDDDVVWPPPLERPLVVRVPLGSLGRDDAGALVGSDPRARGSAGASSATVRSPTSSIAAAATRCTSSSSPHWPRGCATTSELPGSLRALIAARLDQLTPSQRAIVDNAAVLGSSDAIVSLERFARSMLQEFSHDDVAELVACRRARRRRQAVAVPQRRRARRRLPDAHQAHPGATPRRRRRRDPAPRSRTSSTISPITPPRRPSCAPSSGRSRACPLRSPTTAVSGVAPGRHPRRSTPPASSSPSATPAVRSTCSRADAVTERELLLVRCTAETERRAFAEADVGCRTSARERARRPSRGARGRGAPSHRHDRSHAGRPVRRPARARLGDRALFRRLDEPAGSPMRCASAASPRCSAVRCRRPAPTSTRRWQIYHDIDDARGHAWTHQRLAWVAFQAGDFADAEQRAARGAGDLRRARRSGRRQLGGRPARMGVVLPATLRRGRSHRPVGRVRVAVDGATRGRH